MIEKRIGVGSYKISTLDAISSLILLIPLFFVFDIWNYSRAPWEYFPEDQVRLMNFLKEEKQVHKSNEKIIVKVGDTLWFSRKTRIFRNTNRKVERLLVDNDGNEYLLKTITRKVKKETLFMDVIKESSVEFQIPDVLIKKNNCDYTLVSRYTFEPYLSIIEHFRPKVFEHKDFDVCVYE